MLSARCFFVWPRFSFHPQVSHFLRGSEIGQPRYLIFVVGYVFASQRISPTLTGFDALQPKGGITGHWLRSAGWPKNRWGKQRNKETKQQSNKGTKKQRNEETKQERNKGTKKQNWVRLFEGTLQKLQCFPFEIQQPHKKGEETLPMLISGCRRYIHT